MDRVIRIVLADDHPPTRLGVQAALEQGGEFAVVAAVGDAAAAFGAALQHRPDLCLLDVRMPGNGIEAAARITTALPDTPVVMLTSSEDENDLFDSLRAGAAGYLLKDTDPDRLPLALKGVLAGEAALPRTLVMRLMNEFRARGGRRNVQVPGRQGVDLTAREWEVLELMRQGEPTRSIAERLFVTEGTIRTHVASILKKLKAPDRAAAVRLSSGRSTGAL